MAKTTTSHEHDVLVKNDIMKGPSDSPRPHANGCVGCRRAGVCIRCGNPSERPERCISGACPTCCPVIHKHAGNNPQDAAEMVAAAV